jgi:hypothetical protein
MWVSYEEANLNGDGSGFRGLLYLSLGQTSHNGRRALAPGETECQALNPPTVLQPQFDSAQYKIKQVLAILLPEKTEDKIPEGFFSRKWTADDMGRLKAHVRKNSLDHPWRGQYIAHGLL